MTDIRYKQPISEVSEVYCDMTMWTEIRRLVLTGQMSKRAVCREYEIHWKTLEKILTHTEPPGYRQQEPRARPKLDPFVPIIHEMLKSDRTSPSKQRHTAKRVFDRLREEHGYTGGLTVVQEEARTVARLQHPCIVVVHGLERTPAGGAWCWTGSTVLAWPL